MGEQTNDCCYISYTLIIIVHTDRDSFIYIQFILHHNNKVLHEKTNTSPNYFLVTEC